jgi:hypothetical protein
MSEYINVCNICYNNERHHKLKCNTCNHDVCNNCFSNILFTTEKFNENYLDNNITRFKCPYCCSMNIFSINKIKHLNINDKLVKLSIEQNQKNIQDYNNLVHKNNNLIVDYNSLIEENYKMKNELQYEIQEKIK